MKRLEQHKIWIGGLLVAMAAFLVYANTYGNTFLYGDEESIILRNHYLSDWRFLPRFFTENYIAGSGAVSNFYRPFQVLVYAVIAHTAGITPWPFHFASILFHALCGVLLYLLFLELLANYRVAILAALAWVVHPIHTEELALCSGLASPGHLLGILAGLLCFLKAEELKEKRGGVGNPWYIGAMFSFISALFFKESGIVFPGLLLASHIAAIQQGIIKQNSLKYIIKRQLPFWLIAAIYIILRLTKLNFSSTLNFYTEANIFTEHFSYRLYTLFSALGEGLRIIFFPHGLHPEKSWPVFTTLMAWRVWVPFLILCGTGIFAIRRRRHNPLIALGLFWFLFSYLPMSNLVAKVNAIFWDHWFYTPSVGILLIVSSLAVKNKLFGKLFIIIISIYIVVLSSYTWERNPNWRDNETYWRYILSYEPQIGKIWNNLGMALVDKGKPEEAITAYKRAIVLSDMYPQTHHNLANIYRGLGQYGLAEEEFLKAIKMDNRFYHSYIGLGNLYFRRGEIERAKAEFRNALEIYPYLPEIEAFLKRFSR